MGTKLLGYRAYLLRFWQGWEGETLVWRASLETLDKERLGFPDPDSLFEYLRIHLEAESAGIINFGTGGALNEKA